MENTRLERSECDLRKVMYPVQMWHEYFRITGSRSSKNRPVHRDSFSWIDPFSFRAISLSTMFFASDRNETKIKSNIFLRITAISSSYFFRSFYSIFFRSRWNLDNTTDVRSDLYRDSSPGWNLAQIAWFHKNHSLMYVSIVH